MFDNLFNKSSFGLEAGDDFIKFVELVSTKESIKVGRHGEYEIRDRKELKKMMSSLRKIFGSKPVHVSLPHKDEINVEEYLSALKNYGIKVKSSEHRTLSIPRAIIKKGDLGTYMIVDLGKRNSNIFIVSGGALAHYAAASGAIYFLRDEITRHFLHWHIQKGKEGGGFPVKKIIICGSGPNLAEFSEHLSVHMRHKAEVADVWVNILDTGKRVPEINFEESLGFAPALGVALKGF